jgi:hypothetical protein
MANEINEIAAVIRRYPNSTETAVLGTAIAIHLTPGEPDCGGCAEIVADIIERVDPDRLMGAGALAEAIWNDLNPDEN